MATITQSELKSLLTYDPDTGRFTWQTGRRAGHLADTTRVLGYAVITVKNRMYKAHRLAWLYVNGCWPKTQIDHINHDRSDNRIANLRDVTCAVNHQNRHRNTRSAAGFLGVTWHKRDKRWQSHIEIGGKSIYLGQHKCFAKAILARKTAELTYHSSRP